MMAKLTLVDLHHHMAYLEEYDAVRLHAAAEAICVAVDEEVPGDRTRRTRRLADFPLTAYGIGDVKFSQADIIQMAAAAIYAVDRAKVSR
jgi:hypothetical protein